MPLARLFLFNDAFLCLLYFHIEQLTHQLNKELKRRENTYNTLHNVLLVDLTYYLVFFCLQFSQLLEIRSVQLLVLFKLIICPSCSVQPFIIREALSLCGTLATRGAVSRSVVCQASPLMLTSKCN
jgi:hypothetical protein